MKLKFKKQAYQTYAVDSVVDCFEGQPMSSVLNYRMDPGRRVSQFDIEMSGFRNNPLQINEIEILQNIQRVQRRQNLTIDSALVIDKISSVNLDVDMETGTGKTFVYIKTCFEMNKRFGWSKFIVVVPSIAIREGVLKSLEITADYFLEEYGKRAKFFIYNSKQLHNLESFSSDSGINIMVINVQAFNARGKDARRIYEELDDFQSRRPIDVIKANHPILILDEPQKMEGKKTLDSFQEFNPLMILRYSATHKTPHNKVHRLDALDAYNQKLVKKIAVRGISVRGLSGTNAYLYLESIEISRQAPVARIEMEKKQKSGIKRITCIISKGNNLHDMSNELDQYKGFVVSEIDAVADSVSFTNGEELFTGEASGDVNELTERRIQIREAIKAHFEKEKLLFHQNIKVLSLFFIDSVAKYRSYEDGLAVPGEYAKIFEEEYSAYISNLGELTAPDYRSYIDGIPVEKTHNGYFSIDKKTKHMIDPVMTKTERKNDETSDVDAYDLILKHKEKLLSFEEPVRFIFSHSALREGWDNPNVFVICTLKKSDNTISRRQEVGRGMRISVDKLGDRQDDPVNVHRINVLTVIASESYKDFVTALQKDISASLSARPKVADAEYFKGKILRTETGDVEVTADMADGIEFYLIQNGYIDRKKKIQTKYIDAVREDSLEPLPDDLQKYHDQVLLLIDSVYTDAKLPEIENDRDNKTNPLNSNFYRKEFQELWQRINKKAVYTVTFSSTELIDKCIHKLNKDLRVASMQYFVESGEQKSDISYNEMKAGDGFEVKERSMEQHKSSVYSGVKYDLVGKIAETVKLTRRTVADILSGIEPVVFDQFKTNPEHFISEVCRLVAEQRACVIVEHLSYDPTTETYDTKIFTDAQTNQNFSKAGRKLNRHIYDFVVTDSKVERQFANDLDISSEVVVYAKLPSTFYIPTPVGNYNPDWAISFKEGSVKHIYFIAETKGDMSSLELREIEKSKIECARRFFDKLNQDIDQGKVKYDFVSSYEKLLEIVC